MTLEEAKRFYFEYCGFSFHMGREEPAKYEAYRALNIGKEVLKEWDEELLERDFERLWSRPERVWSVHGNILQILRRQNADTMYYLNRLLGEMEKMEGLDLFNITLILENMAGRTEAMKDGGAYFFCQYPDLAKRMNEVTERLIASRTETDERYERAVRRYRSSYYKWTH